MSISRIKKTIFENLLLEKTFFLICNGHLTRPLQKPFFSYLSAKRLKYTAIGKDLGSKFALYVLTVVKAFSYRMNFGIIRSALARRYGGAVMACHLGRKPCTSAWQTFNSPCSNLTPTVIISRPYAHYAKQSLSYQKKMTRLIYLSAVVGSVLAVLIVKREVDQMRKRSRGFEEIKLPEYYGRTLIHQYKDTLLFDVVARCIQDVENFEVRSDDIWVVSWPRSGTTWVQEIVYLIHSNLDFTTAQERTLDDRFPYLEFYFPGVKEIAKFPSPRLIKSHLPLHLLPAGVMDMKPKMIYIARNPRDSMVSYYHFIRMLIPMRYNGDFAQFCDLFLRDKVPYAPWWRHVKDFWEHKNDDNILFLTYEELHQDLSGVVMRIAEFLGKKLKPSEIAAICQHCSFSSMKTNPSVNHEWFDTLGVRKEGEAEFMRKGVVGDWKEYFSKDMLAKLDRHVQLKLGDTGLDFDYELQHDTG